MKLNPLIKKFQRQRKIIFRNIVIFIIKTFKSECKIIFNNYELFLSTKDSCGTNIYYESQFSKKSWDHGSLQQSLISKLLNKCNVNYNFIDAGASYGLFSFYTAPFKNVKRIISIEASPKTYNFLHKSITRNNLLNKIECINAAVSDKCDNTAYIAEHNKYSEWSRVLNTKQIKADFTDYSEIKTITIDHLIFNNDLNKNEKLFIKIDIEGSEPLAFNGMKELFKSNIDFIIMTEFHSGLLNNTDNNGAITFAKNIWDLDFAEIYQINNNKSKLIRIETKNEFLDLVLKLNKSEGYNKITNLLLCKNPQDLTSFR